jgi:hypothetical protein
MRGSIVLIATIFTFYHTNNVYRIQFLYKNGYPKVIAKTEASYRGCCQTYSMTGILNLSTVFATNYLRKLIIFYILRW